MHSGHPGGSQEKEHALCLLLPSGTVPDLHVYLQTKHDKGNSLPDREFSGCTGDLEKEETETQVLILEIRKKSNRKNYENCIVKTLAKEEM